MRTFLRIVASVIAMASLGWLILEQPVDDVTSRGIGQTGDSQAGSGEIINVRAAREHYREAILRQPQAASNYVGLASLQLQQIAAGGSELELVPKALELLDKALEIDPVNFQARAVRASVMNKLHRFQDARREAVKLLKENPHASFVHEVLIDALVELGEYRDAVEMSDRLMMTRPGLPAYSRAAYIRELHGDRNGAIEAMELAAMAGRWGSVPRAWTLVRLGHLYLGANETEMAERVFRGVLDERPDYLPALAGLAQTKLALNSPDEALTLIDNAVRARAGIENLEIRMEVLKLLGRSSDAANVGRTVIERYQEAEAAGEVVDMELADFLADQGLSLGEALIRARRSWEARPNHLHALETYAWALNANGRPKEAIPHIERAMRLDSDDAMVYYRAGIIYLNAGRPVEGAKFLRTALDAHLSVESPSAARRAAHILG